MSLASCALRTAPIVYFGFDPHKLKDIIFMRRQKIVRRMTSDKFVLISPQVTIEPSAFRLPDLQGEPNIAIIQPGSWGDNVNSTLMLKPLKKAFPNSQIDLYTAQSYYSAFDNNPYIDNAVIAQVTGKDVSLNYVNIYPTLLLHSKYQHIINASPCINGGSWNSSWNPQLGENLIFSWVNALERLNISYELPLETHLYLRQSEVDAVSRYLQSIGSAVQRKMILMEVEGESGQSFWNPQWTHDVCRLLATSGYTVFISKRETDPTLNHLVTSFPGSIFFVGHLSIRQCAELFNHCYAFISISSGLSNACNTNWCKKTGKWIELVNSEVCSSMPVRREGKVFWHDNNLSRFIKELPGLL